MCPLETREEGNCQNTASCRCGLALHHTHGSGLILQYIWQVWFNIIVRDLTAVDMADFLQHMWGVV